MEGWHTLTMEMEIIMVDRFYGDGDHHEKMGHTESQLCECYSCLFYSYACLNGRSITIPHKMLS